ncbi:MAG: DUF222 domain-containing protein [Sciscionella sp.]
MCGFLAFHGGRGIPRHRRPTGRPTALAGAANSGDVSLCAVPGLRRVRARRGRPRTGLDPNATANRLSVVRALCERLPATVTALVGGRIDWCKATQLEHLTSPLSPEHATAMQDWTLARAADKTCECFSACARRRVLAGARERPQARRRERSVWTYPDEDGTAVVGMRLPAETVSAAYTRIDQLARRVKTTGDTRSMNAIRADGATDLLLHNTADGPNTMSVRVNLTLDVPTLLGLREHPAHLHGYGPLDPTTARRLAADATWRRILTDPHTGTILDVGRRHYRPPAALAEHIVLRDRSCRFPGCRKPAEHTDLDHTRAYYHGGTTSHDNLTALCRRHHRLKHETNWTLTPPTPGHHTWTTPQGTTHTITLDNDEPPF